MARATESSEPSIPLVPPPETTSTGLPITIGVAFIGHAAAGKSTIIGRLLYEQGALTDEENAEIEASDFSPDKFASVVGLKTKAEREQRETVESHLAFFETGDRRFGLVDVPGRSNFQKNMITGASLADVAVLVVPAGEEAFEEAIARGDISANRAPGLSRQHCHLVKIMGIEQLIVCINQIDTVQYSGDRYQEICQRLNTMLVKIGYQSQRIAFIPMSASYGENITTRTERFDFQWYKGWTLTRLDRQRASGFTLLDALCNAVVIPKRKNDAPARFPIQGTHGSIAMGRLEQGSLELGQAVNMFPSNSRGVIASIQSGANEIERAFPGDIVGIKLDPCEGSPRTGDVMFDEKDEDPPRAIMAFTALVYILNHMGRLTCQNRQGNGGYTPIITVRTSRGACTLTRIKWKMGKSTGNKKKANPKFLESGDQAEIVLKPRRQIPLQPFRKCPTLGRFGGLEGATLVMIGRVLDVRFEATY